ncbi:MAG: MerR family transcriptional regulator [Aeromicrobium sp.]|uniref:transcriptional regulator FtsR n=1 Tax=Aeromicrobium sp. TaxID=1871063 RepID=UPI003C4FA4C0
MTQPVPELSRLGIGKVLDELQPEFPDLSITKIRYLEREGLLDPDRTASGYRKFSYADVERLRFILRQQRDRFWPLNHIRQVLDDMDNGRVPDTEVPGVRVPELVLAEDHLPTPQTFGGQRSQVRLARDELVAAADISPETLVEIEEFGLIRRRSAASFYDGDDLHVASLVGRFAELGLEPRHLRMFVAAADREAALFDQVVTPRARSLDRDASDRAIASLASLSVALHTVLVRRHLRG